MIDKTIKDMYGNKIEVGDVITYPVRQGSNMWMNTAIVRKIEWKENLWKKDVFEPQANITVIVTDTKYFRDDAGKLQNEKVYHTTRSTFISFNRCIKVESETLSGDIGHIVIKTLEEIMRKG